MKLNETSIYKRKLQIEAELKEIEEIIFLFSNYPHRISYKEKQVLNKRIGEYMKLKISNFNIFKINTNFWTNN